MIELTYNKDFVVQFVTDFSHFSHNTKMVFTSVKKSFVIANYIENNHSIVNVQRNFRVRFQMRDFPSKPISFNKNFFFIFADIRLLIIVNRPLKNGGQICFENGNNEAGRKEARTKPKANEENL